MGGGEIEFQANYRLLELGKQSLASPLTALGLSTIRGTRNSMDDRLKKLESYSKLLYYTSWLARVVLNLCNSVMWTKSQST